MSNKSRGTEHATPGAILTELRKVFRPPTPKVIHSEVNGFETTVDAAWLRNMDRFERVMLLDEDQRYVIFQAVSDLMSRVNNMGAVMAFEAVCSIIEKTNERTT